MRANEIFPSKWLKADDLNGREPVVTIDRVEMATVGEDRRPVAYFQGKDKGLVLNRTNFTAIEEIAGDPDTDNWGGTTVQLYVDRNVTYAGKRVPAVRVKPPVKPKSKAVTLPQDDEPEGDTDLGF